jgi:23S rRNA (pseudouridine1915-N3)-methyltransferase
MQPFFDANAADPTLYPDIPATARLSGFMKNGGDTAFIVGGADGLDAGIKNSADEVLALSALTLPHGLARILLAEQLYRAVSLIKGHPYHRA